METAAVAPGTKTVTTKAPKPDAKPADIKEMSWDPITRIVGSLGIYTKVDFANKKVVECHSTSSIFRGYSIFMKNKDPRDTHFITSRICGICGDNHATCSVYAQNMAYGVKPPSMAEWIVNLGEAAEYMFDHNIFQDNLVGVDFCEMMVKETNPGLWEKAKRTPSPNGNLHGYKTIADIMTSLNPFEGEFYRETLQVSRMTREMFCLMEGRHVHPSTLYAGGVGTVPSIQLFTDYQVRLMKYVEFMKKVVPLHDDLFDFFYDALPGYEEVGNRRILLACWGSFQDPDVCDYDYKTMDKWGKAMYVTPGIVIDGELVTTNLVDINLGIRILLGSSYYDDWDNSETFVTHDPLGNPVDKKHPWNQTTIPKPQKRDFAAVARQAHRRSSCARHRRRPDRPSLGDRPRRSGRHRLCQGDRPQRQDQPAQDSAETGGGIRVEGAEMEQHDRTRPGPNLLPGLRRSRGALFRRAGDAGASRRQHEDFPALQGAR
jgi:hydrogenase large subunit